MKPTIEHFQEAGLHQWVNVYIIGLFKKMFKIYVFPIRSLVPFNSFLCLAIEIQL